ncbi:MAG: alpha/beta hydrolase [Pseudomonadota bacterium]
MRVFFSLLAVALLVSACATPEPPEPRESNMRIVGGHLGSADTIVFLVPGALASTTLFGPARRVSGKGVAVVEYRFPGFDGLPADRNVYIQRSAKKIASVANRYPNARVRLMGFSTGAAIAIEAAARIDNADVEVGAISAAVPFPGMLGAGPRGAYGLTRAAISAKSLKPEKVWLEYFKTLLFGWEWESDPATRDWANAYVDWFEESLEIPDDGVGASHTRNLLVWTLSDEVRANPPKVRFYHGVNDTIVPLRLVKELAAKVDGTVHTYRPDAHLLLITRPSVIVTAGRRMGLPIKDR